MKLVLVLCLFCVANAARSEEIVLPNLIALSPSQCKVPGCSNCHTFGRDNRGGYMIHQDFDGHEFKHIWTEYLDDFPKDQRRAALNSLRQQIIDAPEKPTVKRRGRKTKRGDEVRT